PGASRLSLHDALPICAPAGAAAPRHVRRPGPLRPRDRALRRRAAVTSSPSRLVDRAPEDSGRVVRWWAGATYSSSETSRSTSTRSEEHTSELQSREKL